MPRVKSLGAIEPHLLKIIFVLARDDMVYCHDYNKVHVVALAA